MHLLNLHTPHGTAWELLAAMVVVVAMPVLAERIRLPGLIGLLFGGFLIGPNGLGIVSDVTGVVKELGDLGLLYLMFMAGLELDLSVLQRLKKQALSFGVITFALPLVFGLVGALALGYSTGAAVLLGSVFASHTLVTYPTIRRLGLSSNRAVATTVGATVLTDTLALVVLAAVAGSTTGDASGLELFSQIVLGLLILLVWCFLVLPRISRWFFLGLGRQRTLRYGYTLAALLSAAVLADVVGIEGIVGAFFAGLALNRLVPNEGEFMERFEFVGSALFIPMFLVSVGTIIAPKVMADPATLGIALVFVLACVGGKVAAALLTRPLFGFSGDEAGVVFSLSVSQAAATLAATFVGLEIGLFDLTVVNAVMIVVVVSLLLSSAAAARYGPRVPRPVVDEHRIGRSVLVQLTAYVDIPIVVGLAQRIAVADGGVVRPVVAVPDGAEPPGEHQRERLEADVAAVGVDSELDVRHDTTETDAVLHAASSLGASLLVVPAATESWLPALLGTAQHALVAGSTHPVALVRAGTAPPARVVLALADAQARRPGPAAQHARAIAERLHKSGLPLVVVATDAAAARAFVGEADSATYTASATPAWIAGHCQASDVVVVPGGRNGALGAGKATKAAVLAGATVVAVADRASVSAATRAEEYLGSVSRPITA